MGRIHRPILYRVRKKTKAVIMITRCLVGLLTIQGLVKPVTLTSPLLVRLVATHIQLFCICVNRSGNFMMRRYYKSGGKVDKASMACNKPRRTPSHLRSHTLLRLVKVGKRRLFVTVSKVLRRQVSLKKVSLRV